MKRFPRFLSPHQHHDTSSKPLLSQQMKPPNKLGRRTRRCLSGCCLIIVSILVIVLLGVLPIGWILSPTNSYFPTDGTGHESVLHVVKNVVVQPDSTEAPVLMSVDIYADAAIGVYMWEHMFKGRLVSKLEGTLQYGFLRQGNINWRFRIGPSITPEAGFPDVEHLVLVLNGRSQEKIKRSQSWLELVPASATVRNVAVVLLGDEHCNNEWLLWYLEGEKYRIRAVFVVYDSKLVDNKKVFQWPLGVATYRGFPQLELTTNDILETRPYLCHFMGTVYSNNSRVDLMKALDTTPLKKKCYIQVRYDWPEQETYQSATDYAKTLQQSDSVLSPVGMNSECYRVYEALSVGSLPVIEDQKAPGVCDTPYRLLREYNVPAMFIGDWDELPGILEYLTSLSDTELLHQRNKIIKWYQKFLLSMRDNSPRENRNEAVDSESSRSPTTLSRPTS
ncbi:Transmembrane protein 5 [Hypsibius exemplaris]|uniref:Transmembrane protein 5 n=1 Tax=Hypsibius exemplaris TaxID=2072580 RepID=A0A1W0X4N1_HYPEX|nr:Transmembrane protein 5 [Hypsibius exemplaris]